MEYTPVEWHTGDVITEEKLNSMVSGITEGVSEILVVNLTANNDVYTADKTFKEIFESKFATFRMGRSEYEHTVLTMYHIAISGENSYTVAINLITATLTLTTDNENGYPSGTVVPNQP